MAVATSERPGWFVNVRLNGPGETSKEFESFDTLPEPTVTMRPDSALNAVTWAVAELPVAGLKGP